VGGGLGHGQTTRMSVDLGWDLGAGRWRTRPTLVK
jgi:hypothetical protein